MKRTRFEKLVDRAIENLPPIFLEKMGNVAVIVEDRPSRELLERMEIPPDDTLFGFYEGVPLTERGFEAPIMPDTIWIFQEPIEEACESDEEIEKEVQTTIVHEVGHFFGFDDEALEEMGY